MPFEYHIDTDRARIIERFTGDIGLSELMALFDQVFADPLMQSHFNGLADFSRASLDVNFTEASDVIQRLRGETRAARGRWAVITTSPADYGTVRMMQQLGDDITREVAFFRDEETALAWLDDGQA
ncbi:MAG: hypothetical protein ACOCXX_02750 [Planctomycetota bacterium]